jgi:hypothetical protein
MHFGLRAMIERTVVKHALDDFGFGSLDIEAADFSQPDNVVQLGIPPVRIDLITSISGVSWQQAYESRIAGAYGAVPVHFIGRDALIANKRAIGRAKDLADVEALVGE